MGLASLVSCRFRIRWAESCTYECAPSSLFLYCDARAIRGLLYRTSPENWRLESGSFGASPFRGLVVARNGSSSRTVGFFSRFPGILLKRVPDTLALASRRSNRAVASDVQLQPVWRSALRGVWVARIFAGPFARGNAAVGRWNKRRSHVGSVARTALRSKLEQFFNIDIYSDVGRIIDTDGIRIQFIRARGVAILMHSAFNASSSFIEPFLDGTLTRERPSPEIFVADAFLILGVLTVLFTRGRLNAQAR